MSQCMSEGRRLYRLFDPNATKGCFEVSSFAEADKWNEKHWGIFWTVNSFDGHRKKENCRKVLSWAVDLDGGDKRAQRNRIMEFIEPSAVIETKSGYHVYYDAVDGDPENYRDIVERLVEALGGDQNAMDLCRILRVPGFLHWKDPKHPFAIKSAHTSDKAYSEAEMRKAFPRPEPEEEIFDQKTNLRRDLQFQSDGSLWERIWTLDCEEALKRISGTEAVCYEMFSFKRTSSGNLNIVVNGKGTSCWIDQEKRIGSRDKGGPTIWQWVNWYHKNHRKTYELIKTHFPELFNGKS